MNHAPPVRPPLLDVVQESADRLGFPLTVDDRTGPLLTALARYRPGGRLLEIGTGLGAGIAWMLPALSPGARLTTIEINPLRHAAAAVTFAHDRRVESVCADADKWLDTYTGEPFDLAFVNVRPENFDRLDTLVNLLNPAGLYIAGGLLPPDSDTRPDLTQVEKLRQWWTHPDLLGYPARWAGGLQVAVKRQATRPRSRSGHPNQHRPTADIDATGGQP
ncbi:O-methyltransferase [Promicromonospora sp. MS192]|uniref:O-methyltransferase n=1 Tax=Promicromonospora sp. MS192 TaxID=3412684 RepID=UPI003C2F8139